MTSAFGSRFILRRCLLASLAIVLLGCRVETDEQAPPRDKPMQEPNDQGTDAGTPCQIAFGAACGASCSSDEPCQSGLHCRSGVCAAECVEKGDCEKGDCTTDGRCVEPFDVFLDPAMPDPSDTSEPLVCIEGQVEFKAVVPQVWLLLDRSGSMSSALVGTTTRWSALGNVLFGDPADATDRGVVGQFADRMAFGAVFYTTGSGGTGCVLDLESVALAANNYRHIRQRYNKLSPTGGTPTADALAATVAVAASSDLTGGPKLLVLATDGAPAGCAPGGGTPTVEVENEVSLAFKKQIQTFAISVSTGTDIPHMQRVANLGVGLAADTTTPAPLYSANSQEDLKHAFSTILTNLPRSCVFSLNGRVEAKHADQGVVVLNGQTLVYGDENGWTLKQPDQVELQGQACAQVQEGEDVLDINFPCAVFTPVVK
jgi:hypothetical protein